MTGWAPRRFWKEVRVEPGDNGGWTVRLDDRPVRTPAKAPLDLPTRAMADAIAAEWAAQDESVDPARMPVTRSANAAIDKVAPQREEVISLLAAYAETDLLCYRAVSPAGLVQRQAEEWDPVLAWARSELGTPLVTAQGVMHVPQPPASLERLRSLTAALTHFELAGFHDLVSLSGSLILAFAVVKGRLDAQEAWRLSRLDEAWQQALWGVDEEAESVAQARRRDFLHANRFITLCREA